MTSTDVLNAVAREWTVEIAEANGWQLFSTTHTDTFTRGRYSVLFDYAFTGTFHSATVYSRSGTTHASTPDQSVARQYLTVEAED